MHDKGALRGGDKFFRVLNLKGFRREKFMRWLRDEERWTTMAKVAGIYDMLGTP
jgi:hypothetical protein